ncbi:MAG TPA: carbonic anhydrase [Pseudoclavibacter sp.]|nr:carbonic anhydrase [Pseudoclavibacter sp.]
MTTLDFPETPARAWQRMRSGNARFVAGAPEHPHQDVERRTLLADGQTPFAAVFGCGDSRLAAEIIFDVGLGDLFVIRNAGQVIDTTILASLEYAVSSLHVPLIVVLAHDHCGAVTAALESDQQRQLPDGFYLRDLLTRIHPAIVESHTQGDGTLADVARRHLQHTVRDIVSHSELLSTAVSSGTVGVIGVNYVLREGDVHEVVAVGNIEVTHE